MKTKLILYSILVSLCSFPILGFSQIAIGLKAGGTYSTLQGRDAENPNAIPSMTVGAFLNFGGTILALQPEILLTQKGATNFNSAYNVKEDFKINYLEIPVLFKFGISLPVVYPHVYVGPYYAQALSNTYTVTQISGNAINTEYQRMNLRDNDIGAVAGAGLDMHFNRLFINIDGRYGLGFNTIDGGGSYVRRDIHNGNFMLTAGFGFRLTE